MNTALPRVIVAPITSNGQPLGCRPEVVLLASARGFYRIRCATWTKKGWLRSSGRLIWPCGTWWCWKCWRKQLEWKLSPYRILQKKLYSDYGDEMADEKILSWGHFTQKMTPVCKINQAAI